MKCIYGRQECQFEARGKCPRLKTCPYAGKLIQKVQNNKKKGRTRRVSVVRN